MYGRLSCIGWGLRERLITGVMKLNGLKKLLGRSLGVEVLDSLLSTVVYNIWDERNRRRFDRVEKQADAMIRTIILDFHIMASHRPNWSDIAKSLNWYPCI